MATSICATPEKFECGDLVWWLSDFEFCADANGWDACEPERLPTFLRGQASSYFDALEANQKNTYANLTPALRKCSCPLVAREQHYSKIVQLHLDPTKTPPLSYKTFINRRTQQTRI